MNSKSLFVVCLLFGYFGIHRFAERKYITGVIWLLTLGIYGIGWIYDIIRTYKLAFPISEEKRLEKERIKEERKRAKLEMAQAAQLEKAAQMERVRQMDDEGVPYCPRCKSTHLTANKKGYGLGKGVAGAIVLGPFGLLAGVIGKNKIKVTCLKCGHQFKAGA